MSGAGLMLRQVGYTNKVFWRNPASAFFTFVFPLLFLVIFTTLLGNDEVPIGTTRIRLSTYYVASMAAFGLISACYTNVAIAMIFARENGVLKRTRGTPLPPWAYLASRVAHASVVGFLLVGITVVFGVLVYDASFPTGADLFRFIVTLLVGAGCFAAIGLAVTGLVPNADAGPPIVNAIILPLLFLSGVFIATGNDTPAWVEWSGTIFPVKHLVDALRDSFLGLPSFSWTDVGVLALWMVAGILVAAKTFRWEPRR